MANDAATAARTPPAPEQLNDEELVDLFLLSSGSDNPLAHRYFETIISRYQWLINHVVRSSRYRFPAWDSADDVIARVIFKVYRGLVQWRREGKLSSFIARIATSEMIDTIRRVRRDKSWNPRLTDVGDRDEDMPSPIDRAPSHEPSPEAQLLNRQKRELVDQLLEDVCRDWKDSVIVNEYLINNIGAKELVEKYAMSEDVIYQRARRLKVRLIKWLAERGITSSETLLGTGARPKKIRPK
ncbi:MAG: sigma-70 family RNA polymerase sigma factor [Acidobacteria bacterium]|nr:sigma-70 family RNA polymerase sigma factor [Acidobacteriota bacterium]